MEELERKWDLTATSSKATEPTNYFVREYAENSIRTFDGMMPSMSFELTSQTSHALTPHEMMKRGHVLNGYVITSKSADPVTQKTIIGRDIGDFREGNAKLYHRCHGKADDTEELIANFTVEVAMKVTLVGLKTSNEILRLIIHGIGEPIEMEIEHNRYITYFCSDVRAQFPQFRIYHTSKGSAELMKEYLSLVYEHAMPHLKHETEYDYAGWQDDCRYHSGTDADCRSSRCLPNVSNLNLKDVFMHGYNWLDVGDITVTLMMLLHLYLGFFAKLFADAGLPIQHILSLIGSTGSKKTAASRIIYCLFDMDDAITFSDTDRAIELKGESFHDATVLFDDLSDLNDKEHTKKLANFMRQICDSAGRSKSINGGTELDKADTRYVATLTSESSLDKLQQSRRLRNIEVPVKENTFNEDLLAKYQIDKQESRLKNLPNMLECHVSAMIKEFAEPNYDKIIRFIMSYRPPELDLRHARQRRIYSQYCIMAKLFISFGVQTGAIDSCNEDITFGETMLPIIQNVMKYNEELCTYTEPYILFLEALCKGILNKHLRLANSKDEFQNNGQNFIGFTEKGVWKIDPNLAYQYAVSYNRQRGFSATENDILTTLCAKGISEVYQQKGHKPKLCKKVKLGEIQLDFLCLNVEKVKQALQNSKEEEYEK